MYIGTTSRLREAKRKIYASRVKGSNRHRYSVPPGLSLTGKSVFYLVNYTIKCNTWKKENTHTANLL